MLAELSSLRISTPRQQSARICTLRLQPSTTSWLVVIWFAFSPSPLTAQVFERPSGLPAAEVDMIDNQAATHLENARRFLAASQWEEALESLRRADDISPQRLVAQPAAPQPADGFQLLLPTATETQFRLAQLADEAPAALALYRKLIDPLASNWLSEYKSTGNYALLERISSEAFASRSADEALLLAGDWWLERGEISRARTMWQRISPKLSITPQASALTGIPVGSSWSLARTTIRREKYGELFLTTTSQPSRALAGTYPDTDLPLGEVRARLVIASLLENDLPRAEFELEMLRALDPTTRGTIGGKTGLLIALTGDLLTAAKQWAPSLTTRNWATFAGNSARNEHASTNFLSISNPRWTFALPRLTSDREVIGGGRLRPADDMKSLRSYHPIIVGNQVLTRCDAHGSSILNALDLSTGASLWMASERRQSEAGVPSDLELTSPFEMSDAHANLSRHFGVARFTLSHHRGIVYSRMGSPLTGPSLRRASRLLADDQASLWAYDLAADGKPVDGFPIRPESSVWSFEGTPLADDQGLYTLLRRVEGGRSQLYVAAFAHGSPPPALDDDNQSFRPTGWQKWRLRLGSAATLGNGDIDELSHHLLTLDGGTLFINTSQGLIAAVDVIDGKLRWMQRYPRATYRSADPDQSDDVFFRDLTPCLVCDQQIICAPADCDRIFALDRASGRLLWTLPAGVCRDVMHLLGCDGDYLLASGDWLYWIDLRTGKLASQFPGGSPGQAGDAAANPRGLGRGAIAMGRVYYPTRDSILIFSTEPAAGPLGRIPQPVDEILLSPRGMSGGNLVISDTTLLIATGEKLFALSIDGASSEAEPAK